MNRPVAILHPLCAALALACALAACAPADGGAGAEGSRGAPSASPSPSGAAPFVAPIPISLPVSAPSEGSVVTFENAVDHLSEIPEAAWTNIQNAIEANEPVDIETRILIGPKTNTTLEQIEELLLREYRLWAGFTQPSSYVGLVYNAEDVAWAESTWATLVDEEDYGVEAAAYLSQLRAGCEIGVSCWGGMT